MKREIITGIVIAVLVIAGLIFYFIFLQSPSEIPEEFAGQNIILIENFKYNPQELTISVGEEVIWINKDSVKHTVTSDEDGELNSTYLSQDENYSHTFNQAGEYSYYCIPHPFMKGKIIVTENV